MTDYISRADAIDAVKDIILKRFNLADWYEEMLNCGVEIEDTIKALPSADADRPKVVGIDYSPYRIQTTAPSADDTFCKSQLITCNRVKECNGVCPFEDALKHADKTQTMNDQHTVDHDRDWIIWCIKHDGFIKTDRFDKANQIILEALSADAVQGEWIIHGEPPMYVIECSQCGQKYFNHALQEKANFCSNCGARMKGGAE